MSYVVLLFLPLQVQVVEYEIMKELLTGSVVRNKKELSPGNWGG